MIGVLIFIGGAALINRLRGWGPTDGYAQPAWWRRVLGVVTGKYPCAVYLGAGFGFFTGNIASGAVLAAGLALWAAPGWGDYWDGTDRPNNEVGIIDKLVGAVLPPGLANDLVSMALRGLFLWPAFAALWWLNPWYPLIGLGMALQGPIYGLKWLIDDKLKYVGRGGVVAELLTGALIGALLVAGV